MRVGNRSRIRPHSVATAAAAIFVIVAAPVAAGETALFDFERGFDFSRVEARDVKVSPARRGGGAALRMDTTNEQDWPGITLGAPKGKWDLTRHTYLELDVRNVGLNKVTVSCRVDNPGADGAKNCNNGSIELEPGKTGKLRVMFRRGGAGDPSIKLFGMRGYPLGSPGKGTIDLSNVTQILVFIPRPKEAHAFEIDNVRAGGSHAAAKLPKAGAFFPMIDPFGQYVHRDWPGKVRSLDDLKGRVASEDRALAAKPGPEGWDRWGGWAKGPKLKATGFFRAGKHEGRWWLVDPDGRLFFSHGTDCVNTWGATPIEEREHWFAGLPPRGGEMKDFYNKQRTLHGHYAGRHPLCFDFIRANLLRKFGAEWTERSGGFAHRRLRSWGLNTIANWSDPKVYLKRKTPYVATIHFGGKMLEGSKGYWGKFRDVFDPSFRRELRKRLSREKGKAAGDPWCIGFFVDNELSWGDEVSLAVAALASPKDQAAKIAFVDDLKVKYWNIAALNRQWGTSHASWDALLEHRSAPDRGRAREDLTAFYSKTAERYFKTIHDEVKRVAPDNLYLGCRFAWVNDRAAKIAAKHCDVVSYNLYRYSVSGFRFPGGDKPLIIGEFHFGALDRGMFHTGLKAVADQKERAQKYREYVRGALRHPQFVGTHWFKYRDEPTTGRPLDEENYQIGLVDIADTPYPETIEAVREVGYGMYGYRARGGR